MSEEKNKKEARVSPVDLLFWGGCALISVGIGLLWGFPIGLIAAGAACLVGSYLSDAAKRGGDEP